MKCSFSRDGSLNIQIDGITIANSYPAINGIPLRPISCCVNGSSAVYELEKGSITLTFTESELGAEICMQAEGIGNVHDISPIFSARITGCDRAFRQGFGIAGPSGFAGMDDTFDSDGLVAFGNAGCCFTMHAADNSKYRVHYRMENGLFSASIDLENTCACGALPVLYIRKGTDFSDALKACVNSIADYMGARVPAKPAFHWCSWYYLYHNLDLETLEEYLDGFGRYRDIAPFRHIQIDAGYFPSCGDWLEPHPRFPGGLSHAADIIKAAGYEPGIWIGPFMVGDESKLFREHPDWMLKDNEGGYVTCWKQYNEPKPWGYRDSDYYVLDTSHPDAMEYIINVFRTLRSWGYTLFKTDFLLWGMHDSTKVRRHTPGKTSFEYFREFLSAVRGAIGEDAAWLGCIAPFMPAVGYVDMMRIAGDVGAQWEADGFGPVNMIQEIIADQYFSNIYWQNDPDAVLLRDFHIHLKPHQVECLALLQAMSGGVITTSDPVHKLAPDRRALLELICPKDIVHSTFPYWQEKREDVVITAEASGGRLVYFFNPTARDITVACDWTHLLGDDDWHLLKLHGNGAHAREIPCVTIPAQSGVLFFASREKLQRQPRNMWNWDA